MLSVKRKHVVTADDPHGVRRADNSLRFTGGQVRERGPYKTSPPFCLAGTAVNSVFRRPFGESTAAQSDLQIDPGYELMEYFLRP